MIYIDPYLPCTIFYSAKVEGEPTEYYNEGTSSYMKALVNGIEKHVLLQGRNISMAFFICSKSVIKNSFTIIKASLWKRFHTIYSKQKSPFRFWFIRSEKIKYVDKQNHYLFFLYY